MPIQQTFQWFKQRTWLFDLTCLTLVFLALYFFCLGSYPLFIPDEGRYAEVAREMMATRDFVTPRVNGVVFLDKPVLYYWLQAGAMWLFGVNEWAIRFFPALFAVLGCLITYAGGRLIFNRRTGALASIILATTPLYFGGGHYANLDLEVAVLITATLLLLISGLQTSQPTLRLRLLLGAYACSGLAVLTKGLIGIVFPGLIGLLFLWRTGRLAELSRIHLIRGALLFLAIILPWHILAQQANPAFFDYYVIKQQLLRFLSHAEFNNTQPFWFYLPIMLVGFLPWTLTLIPAIASLMKARKALSEATLFCLIWFVVIMVFFSIPQAKPIGYILPVFPTLALLTGHYLSNRWESIKNRAPMIFKCSAATSLVCLIVLVLNANHLNTTSSKPLIAELKPLLTAQDEVIHYYKFYQDAPLYLGQRITLVANWQSPDIEQKDNWVRELWYGLPFQNTADWLINEDIFWQRFESDRRVFVFLNENYFNQFKSRAKRFYVLAIHNEIILISNKPIMIGNQATLKTHNLLEANVKMGSTVKTINSATG